MRTEEHENFLITDDVIRDTAESYNSFDALMSKDDVYDFFKKYGVI